MKAFNSLTHITTILLSLSIPSLAHLMVQYPSSRGNNVGTINQFPCGGMNKVSKQRTLYPIKGGAIGIETDRARTNIEVLMAFGSEPTTEYSTILRKTFTQTGMGKFCMTNINIPEELDIHEGTNATLQVITSTDDNSGGGYYSCSDITFGISAFDFEICNNSTGVTVSSVKVNGHANETHPDVESTQTSAAAHNWNSDLYRLPILLATSLITVIKIMNF